MKKINLRIAELRHKKKITQQELADIVGVSFQTISKWENGGAMPDITYLPILAEYFDVSVDQLIGIVPFNEEVYIASRTGTREFECDGLYIDGMDYFRLCEHTGMEKHWRAELEQ